MSISEYSRVAAVLAAIVLGLCSAALAATGTAWNIGAALQRQLAQPVNVVFSGSPLRQALERLSRAQKVAIVLDRRVDPGQRVELTISDTRLEAALESIARHCGLGMSRVGPVVFIGTPQAASQARALAALRTDDVRRLPPAAQRRWLQSRGMVWDELAVPGELLEQLARESKIEIAGLDRIPHDLWPAGDLPTMLLVDRLTLITVQFGLTFEIAGDGGRATIVPIPADLPEASGGQDRIARPVPPIKRPPSGPAVNLSQVRIDKFSVQEKPVGQVLKQLADRLNLDLQIDQQAIEQAGISLEQRVSVSVEKVTIDELFREVLKSTPLSFRRTQRTIVVTPAK